jgi:phosphoglycolate phosphatase-like HAD superfamily hydrolase
VIYIFDIDGTLADLTHRLHFIGPTPDWDAFFMAATDDKPIWEVITVARALKAAGHRVIMVTGRSEISRDLTVEWLLKYRVPCHHLYMRTKDDHREDNVVKSELLDKVIEANHELETMGGVFEDRQMCVDMFRARGLRVFQVAKGDF